MPASLPFLMEDDTVKACPDPGPWMPRAQDVVPTAFPEWLPSGKTSLCFSACLTLAVGKGHERETPGGLASRAALVLRGTQVSLRPHE